MQTTLDRLREILEYCPSSGKINNRKTKRVLAADSDGLVIIFDRKAKVKSTKYKLERIAFALAYGYFPSEAQKVLHKNLDSTDNRIKNLTLVSRSVFKQIKEAYRNVSGGIRIVPHPTDQFAYVLYWFEGGIEKNKVIQDVVVAKRQLLKLQLKYSKILTKYCIFDN